MSTSKTFVLASSLLGILYSGLAVGQYSNSVTEAQRSFHRTSAEQAGRKQQEKLATTAPLIFWQQHRLPIPFNIKTTTDAREVQLHVSSDQGAHWKLYDRKVPAARRFLFRAPHDGEFWFASRTLHQEEEEQGTTRVAQRPELRVVIDTTRPVFRMTSMVNPSGQVQTTWEISDAHLKTASFQLQYQPLGETNWIPIPPGQPATSVKQRWNGQKLWWPETRSRSLVLRGTIEDEAGNQAIQTGRLFLPAVALRRPPTNSIAGRLPKSQATNADHAPPPSASASESIAAAPATSRERLQSWDDDTDGEKFISTTVPPETKRINSGGPAYSAETDENSLRYDRSAGNPVARNQTAPSRTYRAPSTGVQPDIALQKTTASESWDARPDTAYQPDSNRHNASAKTLPGPAAPGTGTGNWANTPGTPYQRDNNRSNDSPETLPSTTPNSTGTRSWANTPGTPYQRDNNRSNDSSETRSSSTAKSTGTGKWETSPDTSYQPNGERRNQSAETLPSPTPKSTGTRSWETDPDTSYQPNSEQRNQSADPRTERKPNAAGNQNWEPATVDRSYPNRNSTWQPSASSPTQTASPARPRPQAATNRTGYRPGSLATQHPNQHPENSHTPRASESSTDTSRRPYMTHSRRFQLDYDIDAIALANVSQVELWATTDQGRSWQKWGHDADRRSPLEVEVNDPGTYGFRIVIVGRNGIAGNTPSSGAEADVWVTVDHTPPEVKLLAVQTGKGARAGHLVIQWDASDRHLSERPITLRVAESANGPWTIIAEGLQNVSEYAWRPPATIARQVHIQIEARDAAGNQAKDQTRSPVDVRSATPRGRIRGFRSLQEQQSQNARKAVDYREPARFGFDESGTN